MKIKAIHSIGTPRGMIFPGEVADLSDGADLISLGAAEAVTGEDAKGGKGKAEDAKGGKGKAEDAKGGK